MLHSVDKTCKCLVWFICLVSVPIILPLVTAKPLSPSSPSVISSPKQLSRASLAVSHRQPVSQNLVVPNSSTAKPYTAKSPSPTPQPVAAKPRTSKLTAKPRYTAPAIEIRVAIAKNVTNLAIGSSTRAKILDANGKVLQQLPSDQALLAQPGVSAIALGDWQLPAVVWIKPSKSGYVYVGERWYRGNVLLVSQGSTLLAVNYVDLEKYLYSVVGSEMSANAPIEALKAQAIAARSYALVHLYRPASEWYNLGKSERWQVYKGLDSEYNTTHQAVDETGGEILSNQGEIVESLYAASEAIVDQAHGGVGMSQTGAYKLAAQGYDYRQILTVYYPDAQTSRLELKESKIHSTPRLKNSSGTKGG